MTQLQPDKALTAAVLRLLRPLVRILLRNGVSFRAFTDLAKWVYVDVASNEFAIPGRKQTVSRVSVITGLTRKDVSRLQAMDVPDDAEAGRRYNRAARVISGWLRDPRFLDGDGEPAPLPFEGEASFTELVRAHSGDMPARAVFDELERVEAVVARDDGSIRLRTRAYVPQSGEADKLHILGTDVADLITTIDHNLRHGTDAPRYQRKVAYDNLPAEAIPRLREMSEDRAQALLVELNEWLARQDRDANPDAPAGTGRKRAGLGIYYFEEDLDGNEGD